jgi:diguanylate cyclase (GGDEF)-like protein
LRQRETDLQVLADSLRNEIDLRNNAVEALQESESRFKYLASHDSLTGAMNRRSFMEKADAELKAALNRPISCGIVMMDIDFFKNFNDTWGHQAGDEALKHVVTIISYQLRKNDFLGRYGGEEFVFFFDRANRKTGRAIAERVRKAIANTPVMLDSGPVSISASFGVAMLEDAQAAGEGSGVLVPLIRSADLAMYRAKQEGRNKVVCFTKKMKEQK